MNRRSEYKNYMLPGIYHITVKAAEALRAPFGKVVGNLDKTDGDPDAPRVALSPIGKMIEQELLHSITAYYPMVEVQDYVIMPEHMHFIVVVKRKIVNKQGVVLVSARIAPGEQVIMDEAASHGYAQVLILDNGIPEVYHPSTERIERCAEDKLLIVSPWEYHYRRKDENITVMECKTMNCIVQALCHKSDDWWK